MLFMILLYFKLYVPFLGTLNNECRIFIIIGTQNGTLILTTTLWLNKNIGRCKDQEISRGPSWGRNEFDAAQFPWGSNSPKSLM